MTEPTIFGRILDGEIPCHRVYEDDHVLAFLDVGPLSRGHTLVIPKERVAKLHELSDDSAAALGRALPRVARAVLSATGATDSGPPARPSAIRRFATARRSGTSSARILT